MRDSDGEVSSLDRMVGLVLGEHPAGESGVLRFWTDDAKQEECVTFEDEATGFSSRVFYIRERDGSYKALHTSTLGESQITERTIYSGPCIPDMERRLLYACMMIRAAFERLKPPE